MVGHMPTPETPNMIADIGVTGNRTGLTDIQYEQAEQLLTFLRPMEMHHGDCVGSDYELHQIAVRLGWIYITIHPPENPKHRAWCVGNRNERPMAYLARNEVIVRQSDVLLAFPDGPERDRSGTWHTVRMAAKNRVLTIITYPNGHREVR